MTNKLVEFTIEELAAEISKRCNSQQLNYLIFWSDGERNVDRYMTSDKMWAYGMCSCLKYDIEREWKIDSDNS